MTNELRVVVDVNLLVSALLRKTSTPRKALQVAASRGRVLLSQEILDELVTVLARPKFDRYVTDEEKESFIDDLLDETEPVDVTDHITECRDPKDDKYLELAVSGNASHIMTGDKDLLVMNPFRGIAIVTAQEFLNAFEA